MREMNESRTASQRDQWPYSVDSHTAPRGGDGPLISIVMPSYNQARYIEAALLSVVNQQYPNLEFIVLDGGSTDGSVEIIRRYEKRITHWESRKDGGQVPALNRGFELSSGTIQGWLNSDDILLPGALDAVAKAFVARPDTEFIVGKSLIINERGEAYYAVCGLPPSVGSILFWSTAGFTQPAAFWSRSAARAAGPLNPKLPLSFDAEYFLRLAAVARPRHLGSYLAAFRRHPESITSTLEVCQKAENYGFRRDMYGLDRYPAWYRHAMRIYYTARYRIHAGALRGLLASRFERPPLKVNRSDQPHNCVAAAGKIQAGSKPCHTDSSSQLR